MDLASVQASVAAVDRRYVGWLSWEQRGNIITAKPKFTLPDNAHRLILKVFRKLGGKYVSPGYFELRLQENGSRHEWYCSLPLPNTPHPCISPTSGPVLEQLQARLAKLTEAGRQLVKEA